MIGIIGVGSWGTALAILLARNNRDMTIFMWGHDLQHLAEVREQKENTRYLPGIRLPDNICFIDSLSAFIASVKDIMLVIPSKAFRQVLTQIKPFLTQKHRIIWATKGLESETGCFLHEVVEGVLGDIPSAVLSGPSFAREVAIGLPTAVAIASNNQKFSEDLLNYFHSKYFRVYSCKDLIGVQLGGVVKNILAVAAGISDGLQLGANARAALITRGIFEMGKLGIKLGAKSETIFGLSGAGDTILSATDNQSRNKRFGMSLAMGQRIEAALKDIGQVVEAVSNAEILYKLAVQHSIEVPIIQQVHMILSEQVEPKAAIANLLSRQPSSETELL